MILHPMLWIKIKVADKIICLNWLTLMIVITYNYNNQHQMLTIKWYQLLKKVVVPNENENAIK